MTEECLMIQKSKLRKKGQSNIVKLLLNITLLMATKHLNIYSFHSFTPYIMCCTSLNHKCTPLVFAGCANWAQLLMGLFNYCGLQ